jgi:hypothetical protein
MSTHIGTGISQDPLYGANGFRKICQYKHSGAQADTPNRSIRPEILYNCLDLAHLLMGMLASPCSLKPSYRSVRMLGIRSLVCADVKKPHSSCAGMQTDSDDRGAAQHCKRYPVRLKYL